MAMIRLRERGYAEVTIDDNSSVVTEAWEKLAAALKDASSERLNTIELARLIVDPSNNDFKLEVAKASSDIFYLAADCDSIAIWTGKIYPEKLAELICRLPNFHGKFVPDNLKQLFQDQGLLPNTVQCYQIALW